MTALTDSDRWTALRTRDAAFTSSFVYAVLTTKIYCRPNCPSRLARRANIIFFPTAAAAAADKAGFRACKRCKPDQPLASESSGDASSYIGGGEKVNRAVAIILQRNQHRLRSSTPSTTTTSSSSSSSSRSSKETSTTTTTRKSKKSAISLGDLAREVGLSKWHLQREFKRRMGVSPREMEENLSGRRRQGGDEQRQQPSGLATRTTTTTTATTETSPTPSNGNSSFSETVDNPWETTFLSINDADDDEDINIQQQQQQQQQQQTFDLNLDSDFDFNTFYAAMSPPTCLSGVEDGQMDLLRDLFPEIYRDDQLTDQQFGNYMD